MTTKANPGEFDAYAKAEADEPMFTLLARDVNAPMLIEIWAHMRTAKANTLKDRRKIDEALKCAAEMRAWFEEKVNGKS